ncbi:MAG: MFS transporter [Akkermansia sp.]|nr:MFS transporter [Akkermansia sp.]
MPQSVSSPGKKNAPWGSFASLVVIQSMNSLNEKGVQFLLIALGIWMAKALQYPLSVLIVLPFVLFSPLAGWLSDRVCKTRLLQAMVLLQVLVLTGMSIGLWTQNLPLAIGSFTVFCVQAMFFSPAKKGLVKDMVGTENIGFASGILEISSMLALLVGQIGALYIVYTLLSLWGRNSGWEAAAVPCSVCTVGAVIVLILSMFIPRYTPQSTRPFEWNLLWKHFAQLRMLWDNKVLRNSEVGIGYFWFIAGIMMLIVLQMAAEANPVQSSADFMQVLGQQKDSAILFAWLSGGAITGGLVASIICAGKIRTWVATAGGIGMTLGCAALALIPYGTPLFFATLTLTGFAASGYLVPLNALLQDRADDDKRGDVIAAGNLVDCFLGIMSVVLQGGMMRLGISPQWQCGILACTSAMVALFIIRNMRRM